MPMGDRTGPMGRGPMTGRRAGFCAGFDSPGCASMPGRGFGRRSGFGMGFGRGFRRMNLFQEQYYPEPVELTKEQKQKILESELKQLESEKKEIEKRLKELK